MHIITLILVFFFALVFILIASIIKFFQNIFRSGKSRNSHTSHTSTSSEDRMAREYLKKKIDKDKAEDIEFEEVK